MSRTWIVILCVLAVLGIGFDEWLISVRLRFPFDWGLLGALAVVFYACWVGWGPVLQRRRRR